MPVTTEARNRFAQRLFTPLPSRYDRLAEILSMGQNGRWRRAMVDQIAARAAGGAGAAGGREQPPGRHWSWTWPPGPLGSRSS